VLEITGCKARDDGHRVKGGYDTELQYYKELREGYERIHSPSQSRAWCLHAREKNTGNSLPEETLGLREGGPRTNLKGKNEETLKQERLDLSGKVGKSLKEASFRGGGSIAGPGGRKEVTLECKTQLTLSLGGKKIFPIGSGF